jgi:hypothetical protein
LVFTTLKIKLNIYLMKEESQRRNLGGRMNEKGTARKGIWIT